MYEPLDGLYLYMTLYFVAYIMFFTGLVSLTFPQRSLVLILLSLEVMLLGISMLCILGAKLTGTVSAQLVIFVILVLGGVETGIGLALVMLYYYQKGSVSLKDISDLKY